MSITEFARLSRMSLTLILHDSLTGHWEGFSAPLVLGERAAAQAEALEMGTDNRELSIARKAIGS